MQTRLSGAFTPETPCMNTANKLKVDVYALAKLQKHISLHRHNFELESILDIMVRMGMLFSAAESKLYEASIVLNNLLAFHKWRKL